MLLVRLLLVALLAFAQGHAAAQAPAGVAERGVVQVPRLGDDVVDLMGEWGFAWQQFVDPNWAALPTTAFAPALGGWNDVTAGGKPDAVADGWASYALAVHCPAGERYAIAVPNQRTAEHVYVNGRLVGAHGDPGTSAGTARPAVHTRNPISQEFDCPLRLTVHLSNYSHRTGGMFKPIQLGTANALAAQREQRVIGDAALLGAYLLTAALTIVFFLVRREDKGPLLFGLFCIAIAIYADITGERLLLRVLPQELPWELFLRIEWLSWFAALGLFSATLRGLFPDHVRNKPVDAFLVLCGLGSLVVLATPGRVYSHLAPLGQVLTVVIVLHATWSMVRAALKGSRGARVLLVGLAAILAALVADVVLYYFYAPQRRFVPVGAAVFVLMPAFLLVRRLGRALGAEARTRTLEENARLREDVERMSRHDLKTPLNSILGVARILGDDPKLPPEHRELVAVLERAGYRLLEMVNLSLGLFKMETGSYEFRPQAVNLREVASRVLVDLHAVAEAAQVRLSIESSAPAPVYVRGEELLCYSIVANLVKNAIEATPAGGVVTLHLAWGDPVRLEVRNPGEMPRDAAERFFRKYATAGKSGGTGLGAYSARLMAQAQRGDVQMRTGPAGTVLMLQLEPLTDDVPALPGLSPPIAPPEQQAADFAPTNVLVVDDDEYNRLIVRRYLPTPPFSVETAVNGQDAVESMQRHWPDCLLVDLEMPVMDGLQVIAWVRRQEAEAGRPRCMVVMLSSHDERSTIELCLAAGADHYLSKPASREALWSVLRMGIAPAAGASPPRVAVDPDLADTVPEFLASRREIADGMQDALRRGDRESLRALAHKAGGGLALYGFEEAAARCRQIEALAREGDATELAMLVGWVREYLRTVKVVGAVTTAG